MHSRENTPDILGSIMTGSATKKTDTSSGTALGSALAEPKEDSKEKATFNLPVQVLAELEEQYYQLRKLCKSKQVSKTLIVEEALKITLEEFMTKKKESALFHRIDKAIKQ